MFIREFGGSQKWIFNFVIIIMDKMVTVICDQTVYLNLNGILADIVLQ